MKTLLRKLTQKSKNAARTSELKKKIKILQPLQEEDFEKSVSREAYKAVFKRCHQDLKEMRIGKHSKGQFFKSGQKLHLIMSHLRQIRREEQMQM